MTVATFSWKNLWDLATLTSRSQNPLFPASNTQQRWSSKVYRSVTDSGTLTEWLASDLGADPDPVQAFHLKNHNFSSSAVIHIQADDNPSFTNIGTTGIDQNLILYDGLMSYFWATSQTFQYWRLYMVDTAPLGTYLKIGRIFLGPYFAPAINIQNDFSKKYNDPSDILSSDGGQLSSNQKTRYRTTPLKYEGLSDVDEALFDEFFMDRGASLEFFYTLDRTRASETTRYVRIVGVPEITHVAREEIYNVSFEMEDLR
jgi:hypothetical protein